jgi:hypothetical protein
VIGTDGKFLLSDTTADSTIAELIICLVQRNHYSSSAIVIMLHRLPITFLIAIVVPVTAFHPMTAFTSQRTSSSRALSPEHLLMSTNADLFSSSSTKTMVKDTNASASSSFSTQSKDKLTLEAQRLRKEAAEMEMALRDEARAKGLPEELINKLAPIRTPSSSPSSSSSTATTTKTATSTSVKTETITTIIPSTAEEIQSKLGYLNTQDPVRFVTELQRIKMRGYLKTWDSEIPNKDYNVNAYQLKAKCDIDPVKLRLDEVGYDYKMVLVAAVAMGTIFGLSASQIGGQTGFLLGYLSALIPIVVVGIGSIAPALIGDVLLSINTVLDEKLREKLYAINAGKFLVGYCLGLPISRFDSGSMINTVDFYQVKPTGLDENEAKQYFSKRKYNQDDIARSSATCIAGPVAECIEFGESSGNAAADVNTLQQLVLAIEPALNADGVQNHIRWSAMTAHTILTAHKEEYKKLVQAFKDKKSLEECIAIMESTSSTATASLSSSQ